MRFRKFIPPMSIVLFILLAFAGTYYVRMRLLERAMVTALEMDDEAMIGSLLDWWPCPVNVRVRPPEETRDLALVGSTPLHWAVWHHDLELVTRCLARGADVNARTINGWTPLYVAAAWGRREIAKTLLAAGADVNALDYAGNTALHAAIVVEKYIDTAPLLLAAGADVNARNHRGETALHVAVLHGSWVDDLLAGGADVNVPDAVGRTPLHVAASYSRTGFVEILLSKGARVNARDNAGQTPLALARARETHSGDDPAAKQRVIDLLRKAGAKE